jgi:biotin transport system substrate-specific component
MKISTKNMIITSLFASLMAVSAILVAVPLGPVNFTLQIFFVILSGIILGPKYGPLSQIIYMVMGLIGLPVFSGGMGGFSYIFAPSFGYIIGFILASYIVGKISQNFKEESFFKFLIASLIGLVAIYAVGFPYLYLILTKVSGADVSFTAVFKSGVLIFLPGDVIKCILASLTGKKMISQLKKQL